MRTMTIKKGSGEGNAWRTVGWHEFTIKAAKYETGYNKPYLQMTFEEAPDNFNCRVWEVKNKDGEEFAIGNVFRLANAGISTEKLTTGDGTESMTLQIDDTPTHLIGKKLNILVYEIQDDKGTWARAYKAVAPTELTGTAESFTSSDVDYHKAKAIKDWNAWPGKDSVETHEVEQADGTMKLMGYLGADGKPSESVKAKQLASSGSMGTIDTTVETETATEEEIPF